MTEKNYSPAIAAFNKLAEGVLDRADSVEENPEYDIADPENYTMPSSMMRGTQIDLDQILAHPDENTSK